MSSKRTESIKRRLSRTDDRGRLKVRESTDLEFKQSFSLNSMARYAKILASFANAKGGSVVFGVRDNPRELVGVNRDLFEATPIEKIQQALSAFLSPELTWEIDSFQMGDHTIGYLGVSESLDKPVICKTNKGSDLKSGEIYYRYRGQSKVIEFAELKQIHLEIREREKSLWVEHIQRIARIGPTNVAFLDLLDGSLESGALGNRLIVDKELLDQLKKEVSFVESGRFSENEGAPTLRIVGELESTDQLIAPTMEPERDYPHVVQTLADELQIRNYDVQILIWKLKMKGDPRYHARISSGKKSHIDKYSRIALREIEKTLFDNLEDRADYLKSVSKQYQKRSRNPAA
jgi:hypothetical protein